jgi:hypothetical protein
MLISRRWYTEVGAIRIKRSNKDLVLFRTSSVTSFLAKGGNCLWSSTNNRTFAFKHCMAQTEESSVAWPASQLSQRRWDGACRDVADDRVEELRF